MLKHGEIIHHDGETCKEDHNMSLSKVIEQDNEIFVYSDNLYKLNEQENWVEMEDLPFKCTIGGSATKTEFGIAFYGGYNQDNELSVNDLWIYQAGSCYPILNTSKPRKYHAAVYDPSTKSLIIIGGMSDNSEVMCDIVSISLLNGDCTDIHLKKTIPLCNHSAVLLPDHQICLFGGYSVSKKQNSKLYIIDTNEGSVKIIQEFLPFKSRINHSMIYFNGSLIIYGGYPEPDPWIFDIEHTIWFNFDTGHYISSGSYIIQLDKSFRIFDSQFRSSIIIHFENPMQFFEDCLKGIFDYCYSIDPKSSYKKYSKTIDNHIKSIKELYKELSNQKQSISLNSLQFHEEACSTMKAYSKYKFNTIKSFDSHYAMSKVKNVMPILDYNSLELWREYQQLKGKIQSEEGERTKSNFIYENSIKKYVAQSLTSPNKVDLDIANKCFNNKDNTHLGSLSDKLSIEINEQRQMIEELLVKHNEIVKSIPNNDESVASGHNDMHKANKSLSRAQEQISKNQKDYFLQVKNLRKLKLELFNLQHEIETISQDKFIEIMLKQTKNIFINEISNDINYLINDFQYIDKDQADKKINQLHTDILSYIFWINGLNIQFDNGLKFQIPDDLIQEKAADVQMNLINLKYLVNAPISASEEWKSYMDEIVADF